MDASRNELVETPPNKKVEDVKKEFDEKYKAAGGKSKNWEPLYKVGELVEVKGYWFKVKEIGAKRLILTPHGATKQGHDKTTMGD